MNSVPADAQHGDASSVPSLRALNEKPKFQPTTFVRRVIETHTSEELNRTAFIGHSDAESPTASQNRISYSTAEASAESLPILAEFRRVQSAAALPSQGPSRTGVAEKPSLHRPETRSLPSKAFDRLAFRAVSQTFSDLQHRGILLISEDSTQKEAPFQLKPSVARFFMTDQQAEQVASQSPEAWPPLPHSDAMRQDYHVHTGGRPDEASSQLPQHRAIHSEDFLPAEPGPHIYPRVGYHENAPTSPGEVLSPTGFFQKDTQKDNKILTLLKYAVKYTNHSYSGPSLKSFLARPLADESRELRMLYDSLGLTPEMEDYWNNLQKLRHASHLRWRYHLTPVNIRMSARKLAYKIQWPNRYMRQKSLWRYVSQGGEIRENPQKGVPSDSLFPDIYEEERNVTPSVNEPSSGNMDSSAIPSQADMTGPDFGSSFVDWIKTSAANLSVTISFAWNELKEDGVLQKDIGQLTQVETELLTSLRDLDANIKHYGEGNPIQQEDALEYARVVLRFTQGLHDYLENKDRRAAEQLELADETAPRSFSHSGRARNSESVDSPSNMALTMQEQMLLDSLQISALSATSGTAVESNHRDSDAGPEADNPGKPILSDETRSRLLRSARLHFYEKHRSPSLSPLRSRNTGHAPLHTESTVDDSGNPEDYDSVTEANPGRDYYDTLLGVTEKSVSTKAEAGEFYDGHNPVAHGSSAAGSHIVL